MKFIYLTLLTLLFHFNCFSQQVFTAKKGLRFFPGHLHAVVTVDSADVKHELFNHWYSWSYAQLREITVPPEKLSQFNAENDSIQIKLRNKDIRLVDKKYHFKKRVKHKGLCASPDYMRKIAFAYKITAPYEDIGHFALYERDELKLPEDEFIALVSKRLKERIK